MAGCCWQRSSTQQPRVTTLILTYIDGYTAVEAFLKLRMMLHSGGGLAFFDLLFERSRCPAERDAPKQSQGMARC